MKYPARFVLFLFVSSIIIVPCVSADVILDRLGDLPGATFHSDAMDVSDDGLVVVGRSISNRVLFYNYFEAFRWERYGLGSAMDGLGDLDDIARTQSWANAITGDRSVIVGRAEVWDDVDKVSHMKAFKSKTGLEGMTPLYIDQMVSLDNSEAHDVTDNGEVIVGQVVQGILETAPFMWSAGNVTYLDGGTQYPHNLYGIAYAIDAGGQVVVGTSYQNIGYIQPACWVSDGSKMNLVLISGAGAAYGVSSDGKIAVGSSGTDLKQAFYYDVEGGGSSVGYLPPLVAGYMHSCEARDISADYSVIVGWAENDSFQREAVIWIKSSQNDEYLVQSLNTYVDDAGINRNGFHLEQATAITEDGTVIVGSGRNVDFNYEAFRLRVEGVDEIVEQIMGVEMDQHGNANTPLLGPINGAFAPNLYSHSLGRYCWFAEQTYSEQGAWFFLYDADSSD